MISPLFLDKISLSLFVRIKIGWSLGDLYMIFWWKFRFSLFSSSTIQHFAQHRNRDGQCLWFSDENFKISRFSSFMFWYLDYIPMKIHYLLFLFIRSSGNFAMNRLSNEKFLSFCLSFRCFFLKFACLFFRWFYGELFLFLFLFDI